MTLPALHTSHVLHPSELLTSQELSARHIPFSGLRYSTEAFIDYAIPECQPKHNYALIGPGVSQNAAQPVSLREPHGFQVGGVRIPHGKINTPHMHFTCEVFICTRGDWRVQWGFNPAARELDIGEGDLASIPTWIYRGFTNLALTMAFCSPPWAETTPAASFGGPAPWQRLAPMGCICATTIKSLTPGVATRWRRAKRPCCP